MSADAFYCQQRIEALKELSRRARSERTSVFGTLKGVFQIFADGFLTEIWNRFLNPSEVILDGLMATGAGPIGMLIAACFRIISHLRSIGGIVEQVDRLSNTISEKITVCERDIAEATAQLEMAREPLVIANAAVGDVNVLVNQANKAGTG